MKHTLRICLFAAFTLMIISCGNGKKANEVALQKMKTNLDKLKTERDALDTKIIALEAQIAKLDTGAVVPQKPKLVAFETVSKSNFRHYLDLQGKVDAQNVTYITPRGQGGQIRSIYVKEGDYVRKGQLVMRLDNSVALENVNAIKTQMNSVKAQLALAQSVYERQKNLWSQHIGTEVQLLQAKTNVESLQGQLNSIAANVKAAQEQANMAEVHSNVNGTVDEVTAHVGELFTGSPAGGYIRVVSNSALKIVVNVPESNLSKISKGTPVIVEIPDAHQTFNSVVTFVSQTIGASTRGAIVEVRVPAGMVLRPNQIAIVKLLDYSAPNSIAIPLNILQTDENGKYVLVVSKENNQLIARKKPVVIGQLYGDEIEIKSGIKEGDQIITEGYLGLFDGQLLTTEAQ